MITSISPAFGLRGGTVAATIAGTSFIGATAVTFSGTGVTGVIGFGGTSTSLPITTTITAGAALGVRTVTVTAGGITSAAFSGFTVTAPPAITSISPPSAERGSVVPATIVGTNLDGVTAVTFSGTGVTYAIGTGASATNLPLTITIASDTAVGDRGLYVGAAIGTSNTITFTITSATVPVISDLTASPPGLSQAQAPLGGGAFTLTVRGQTFGSGAVVTAGTTALTTTFVSSTQLTAQVTTAVLSAAGPLGIKVTNPGAEVSNVINLNVVERADINANRSVSIGDALVCALTVGGINKPPLPNSVGDLNLSSVTNIGDCLVVALFAGRINANLATPAVTSVSPPSPSRGDALTISGFGFAPAAADNQVLLRTAGSGWTRVTPSAATPTSLTVTVPNDAVSGALQVYRLDAPMGGAEFPLTVSGTTTPLEIMTVSPFFGVLPGGNVSLTGMGFDTAATSNTVLFKSATGTTGATVTAASATGITVTVPNDAICGPVTVGVGNQITKRRSVTIAGTSCGLQLADVVGSGLPGETLVLEGAGFDVVMPANNVVKFTSAGGTVNATVVQVGGTQVQVKIPESAIPGNVNVTVGSTTSNAVTYSSPSATAPSSVDVVVNSTDAVGAYQVTIAYDKNIVQLTAANVKGGTGAGFTATPTAVNIDNLGGTVTLNAFQTGNSPAGTFTVANLVFTPVALGTTNLTLSGITLTDKSGANLPSNRISLSTGTITAVRVP
ncbi:MAG: hypothetical protein HY646_15995 [Acidobacteria bacterium]|nr:hypothetical protein [Acidobacteriota bacterium]